MVTLLFAVLMGCAGFSIDLGRWYLTSHRVQNAADAAALAAAALLFDGNASAATTAAQKVVADHNLGQNVTVNVTKGPMPSQVTVSVTQKVPNIFVAVLGVEETSINRWAMAEYTQAAVMGSPDNTVGGDPENSTRTWPDYWLKIGGPSMEKVDGDRFMTAYTCAGNAVYKCHPSVTPANDEHDPNGYFFQVKVPVGYTGNLRMQVYDPANAVTGGSSCTAMLNSTQTSALRALTNAANYTRNGSTIAKGYYDDAASRYASGATHWCPGDSDVGEGDQLTTGFIMRAPDNTPASLTDNPVLSTSTCKSTVFPGYRTLSSSQVYDLLSPTSGTDDGQWKVDAADGRWTFAETFRRWVTICEIPAAQVVPGTYYIQVRTNVSTSAETIDTAVRTGANNGFALRAGKPAATGTGITDGGVAMSAVDHLPIYANSDGANSDFYAVRVLPSAVARTLEFTLFDMGDAANSGTLQIKPGSDSNMTTFSGCTFQRDDNGNLTSSASTCTLSGVNASNGYNGRLVTIEVPIPSTYTCNGADRNGCWVHVKMTFPSGTSVHDFTTWTARIKGGPVRLVA